MARLRVAAAAALAALLRLAASAGAPPVSTHDVSWASATPFDGKNYADAMPLGNGRVAALAWGNASTGGLELYIRSPVALHSDSQVFTIARLSVSLSPNPCSPAGFWNQSLHLADGAVTLECGPAGGPAVALRAFADAGADAVVVTAAAVDGATPYALAAALTSVRPAGRFAYQQDFTCAPSSSGPDVVLAALPAPAPAGATVGLLHVNDVAGGDFSLFNATMTQQGLSPLLGAFADPLDGRIFGCALTGAAGADGAGAPLVRTSSTTLASAAPAPAFALLLAVRIDAAARGDVAGYTAALAADVAAPVAASARAAATRVHWADFWAKSYFAPADDPPPPGPSPPPSPATLGAFPCGGALAARQTVALDAATGALTFPAGTCLAAPFNGWVDALPCNATPSPAWRLVPCTARGCTAGEMWVLSPQTYAGGARQVLGFPGAAPPWLDAWTPDDPTGDCKNELFAYNATDSTLRALNCNNAGACLTVNYAGPAPPPPPGGSLLAAQYARTRFVHAVQGGRGVDAPIPFNGMLMTNQAGTNGPSDVDYRQWGPNHWFQNTRMP